MLLARHAHSGLLLLVILALTMGGCSNRPAGTPPADAPSAVPQPLSPVQFADDTAAAGIGFIHNSGAFGLSFLPEIMGSGAAFIDYDGDGYPDIFFVNSRNWTAAEIDAYKHGKGRGRAYTIPPGYLQHHSTCALYHNNRNGTFQDVTHQAGLDIEMYGMGVAVGDYDNDGRPDLYVTGYGRNYLLHNETSAGTVRFRDLTDQAGVRGGRWCTGAAWVDYDRDGKLDLFVCRYVLWSPATDTHISPEGQMKAHVGPLPYAGEICSLYRNLGHGRFQDVSEQAGISRRLTASSQPVRKVVGKALGVAVCDCNNDGWPDLVVTNDGLPNFLFRNSKNGTFAEVGVETSIAYDEGGKTRAGMGLDVADVDNSGHDTIAIGNYSLEMLGLYHDQGGFFADVAPLTAVGQVSLRYLTFGCCFTDYDNDGRLDLLTANGHVDPDIEKTRSGVTFAERPLLFHNEGRGQFKEVGLSCGAPLARPLVARGVAGADIDLDGDVDVLYTINDGAPLLLRNDGGNKNNSIRVVLEGTRSNRSAIGAAIEAKIGTQTCRRMVKSGSSYLSQSELPVTLGMGQEPTVETLTVRWPSGKVSAFKNLPANHILWINEANGLGRSQALARSRAASTSGGRRSF